MILRDASIRIALALAFNAVAGLLLAAHPAQAAVYKCVDAQGQLSYSQSPCASEQRQELLQLERPMAARAGGNGNRYRDWQELTEGYACDDVDSAMAVFPNRSSMVSLMADVARQPGRSLRWIQAQAERDPTRLQDGYLFRGALCTMRLVDRPGEFALSLGWYSAAPRLFGPWNERRLLAALQDLGYGELARGAVAGASEMRFEEDGFNCYLRVHRSKTDASLDLDCRRGDAGS